MRLISSLVVALLLCAVSVRAQADSVVLLGLRSVEGDDDFANDVTQALRGRLARMSGMQLSDRAVSLSQMSMAYGCEEPDAACLTDIAAGLQTQHVIYGTIRRTSTRSDYQYSLSISFFSSESGSIENTVTHSIPQGDRALDRQAEAVLSSLMGLQAETGSIMVRANVPAAEITVNEQSVGTTVDGSLRLSGLAPGRYKVTVTAPDMPAYRTTVSVVAGESTAVTATLEADTVASQPPVAEESEDHSEEFTRADENDGSVHRIVGYSLLGVAALGVAGTVYSWASISGINNDADFKAFRTRVGEVEPSAKDVCATNGSADYVAWRDKIHDLCDRADTLETLQWVFLGAAVATGAGGTFFLLTAGDAEDADERAEATPMISFKPRISRGTQAIEATFRF